MNYLYVCLYWKNFLIFILVMQHDKKPTLICYIPQFIKQNKIKWSLKSIYLGIWGMYLMLLHIILLLSKGTIKKLKLTVLKMMYPNESITYYIYKNLRQIS